VMQGCVYIQMHLSHCDICMDAMTTLHEIKEFCQKVKP
jgi:hypothetical protein